MTSAPVSVRTARAIARLAKLLDHPLRVRLMSALATSGLGSATAFSDQFGDVTVGDCHYHLTVLRDGGVIELVHVRQVRGVTERVYRLRPWSRWHGARQLRRLVDLLVPATNSEKKAVVTVPLVVDEEGLSRLTTVVEAAVAAVDRIAAESQDRLRDDPDQAIKVVVTIFAEADQGGEGPCP